MTTKNKQADELTGLLAMSGELPLEAVYRLGGGRQYKVKLVINLRKSGVIKTHNKDGLRGHRLTAETKKTLMLSNPERFSFYLTGDVDTNKIPSSITRRLRLHRVANALVTMYNAGVEIFRDRKESVFNSQNIHSIKIDKPCFYTSREFKEIGRKMEKVKNGRAVGMLLTGAEIFTVYNTENYTMKWDYNSELDMKSIVSIYLSQQRGLNQKMNGLLLGNNMEMLLTVLAGDEQNKRGYFFLDNTFDRFIYLTNDRCGEILLRLLCDGAMRAELDEILRQNLNPPDKQLHIENDAIDKESGRPVLFAYLPDMPRLARFCTSLVRQEQTGSVICFDFQEKALSEYCGNIVEFEAIDFAEFERSFFGEGS